MEAPSVSACMIVRDEEDNLARCLGALRPAVDDIVLVDTGSTDRTIDIARQFDARIFHFAWIDDFGAARNESLRHAAADWIIWVDADDELVEQQPGALRKLVRTQNSALSPQHSQWGYWLDVRCPYGQNADQEVHIRQWRLFPNGRGIQFRGRIHEEPWPPEVIQADQIASQRDVTIVHWGYATDRATMSLKSERNRRLLEQAMAAEPDQPLHHFNLGRQLVREGDDAGASRHLDAALDLWFARGQPAWSFVHAVFSFAAAAALHLEQFDKVLAIEARTPPHLVSSELLCSAGAACWRLERRREAIARLERAWQDPSVIKPHLHDEATATWQPLLMLAGLYDQVDQPGEGYARAQRGLAFAPQHPELLMALAHLAARSGQPADTQVAWLRELLNGPRDEGFKARGRRLLLDLGSETDDASLALEALSGDVFGVTNEQRAFIQTQLRQVTAA